MLYARRDPVLWGAVIESRGPAEREAGVPPMPSSQVPESHRDLLERPLFAHIATLRPDGSPQSSVMWFAWDGERVRFSHTRSRQKYRNLENDPRLSFHVQDPDNPYRALEVRGRVESMVPDAGTAFYRSLQKRYDFVTPVFDADVRVIITIAPMSFVAVDGGLTQKEIHDLTDLMKKRAANDSVLTDRENDS
jgi:PPOX class probable F420-dependent enzyme